MKTAMKRLLSFVLVAMMLVSVLPFQASAAAKNVYVTVYEVGTENSESLGQHEVPEEFTDEDIIKIVEAAGYKGTFGIRREGENVYVDYTPAPPTVTVYITVYENGTGKNLGAHEVPAEFTDADITGIVEAKGYEGTFVVRRDGDGENVYVDFTPVAEETKPQETKPEETKPEETKPQETKPEETKPEATEKKEYTVTFIFCPEKEDNCDENVKCDGETVVRTTKDGKLSAYDVPTVPSRYGYTFAHWYNETNKTNGLLDTYTSDVTYKAVYEEKADSNMHKLKVYGITYNHGKTNTISTPLATLYVEDNTNLLTALKGATAKIKAALNESPYSEKNDFEWDGVTFYDDDDMDKEDEVSSGTKVTGDGNYYVKVKYTGNDKVQIYVHTSKSMKIKDTVTLTTYAPGETITKSKIIDAVEDKGWSYKYFYTYTENEWAKIVDGGTADQTKSFTVQEGATEIHVYLTNASSSGSTNKSDNPKTGDTILMAVTVMGLSATALAAAYVFMKKRAI